MMNCLYQLNKYLYEPIPPSSPVFPPTSSAPTSSAPPTQEIKRISGPTQYIARKPNYIYRPVPLRIINY